MIPRFFLGTHHPDWLGKAGVPLFVSHRRLGMRKTFPRAVAPWALDSGGFSELSMYGTWKTGRAEYVAAVRRYRDEIGSMAWATPQDWMCEPVMLAKTGLTVKDHQRRTVANYLSLRGKAPDLPFAPVLQGWTLPDYHECVEMYDREGVDLRRERVVGLGSVCRRQGTAEIGLIVRSLAALDLNLHGFGVKTQGLIRYFGNLWSADSMAWSYEARRRDPLPGHRHKNCANCLDYALQWRSQVISRMQVTQLGLPLVEVAS